MDVVRREMEQHQQLKSSDELIAEALEEIEGFERVIASKRVPAISIATKREHPDWSAREIADDIHNRMLGKWAAQSIYQYLDASVYDETAAKRNKATWERRNQQKVEQSFINFQKGLENAPVENPKVEYEENEEATTTATSLGGPTLQPEKETPTPIESYEQIVKAAEKFWTPMTGKDRLIASETVDVLIEHIKPSRKLRLRLFKGLDTARANHLTMVLIWLDKLIQDTLKDCLEINKERSDEITK